MACLRSKTPSDILDSQASALNIPLASMIQDFLPYGPVVDSQGDIVDQPYTLLKNGDVKHVPILQGVTKDEGKVFSPSTLTLRKVYDLF